MKVIEWMNEWVSEWVNEMINYLKFEKITN